LKKHIREHEVKTVPEAGWAGKKNGDLLRAATGSVDVFVTIDSNLLYQQTVGVLAFGVVLSWTSRRNSSDFRQTGDANRDTPI
jgi:hypothetical protein